MSLTLKNRIRIRYIKTANSANRVTNVAVEAVGRGLNALNDKTAGALDRRQDKTFGIRQEELRRIYLEADARKRSLEAQLRELPEVTATNRVELFRKTQT